MNQRKTTRRFYDFEEIVWIAPSFTALKRTASIDDLQALAALVWQAEGGKGPPPTVHRRKPRTKFSFYVYDDNEIHLAPKHQHLGGMLHEMAHALGRHDKLTHGPAFRRRCLRLYRVYGGWDGQVTWEKS